MANQSFLNKMKGKKVPSQNQNSDLNENSNGNFIDDDYDIDLLGIDNSPNNSQNKQSSKDFNAHELISKVEELESENCNFEDPMNVEVGLDLNQFESSDSFIADEPDNSFNVPTPNQNNDFSKELDGLKEERDIFKNALKEANETIKNYEDSIEKLNEKIESLEKSDDGKNIEFKLELETVKREKVDLELTVKDLNETINKKDNEIDSLKEKYEDFLNNLKENGVIDSKNDILVDSKTLEENEFLKAKIEELEEKLDNHSNNEKQISENENDEMIDFNELKNQVVNENSIYLSNVSEKVLSYVCIETVKHLLSNYKSEMYTEKYTNKLFNSYIEGETDSSNILFKELISEVLESNFKDEYLKDVTSDVLKFIKVDKSGLNKNFEYLQCEEYDIDEDIIERNIEDENDKNNHKDLNIKSSEKPKRKPGRPKLS